MSPSKAANVTLRPFVAAAPVLALLLACSGTKEWEAKPGTLELYATPLPPVPGQPLTLGVLATNVGPVDVFQGTERIASLVNVEASKRVDFQAIAVSAAVPKAVAVAYDFRRLEVEAVAFGTRPNVPDGGTLDAGPRDAAAPDASAAVDAGSVDAGPFDAGVTYVEDCPGLVSLIGPTECGLGNGASLGFNVRNLRAQAAGLRLYYASSTGGACQPSTTGVTLQPNSAQALTLTAGITLEFFDKTTTQVFRTVRLPSSGTCNLIVLRP